MIVHIAAFSAGIGNILTGLNIIYYFRDYFPSSGNQYSHQLKHNPTNGSIYAFIENGYQVMETNLHSFRHITKNISPASENIFSHQWKDSIFPLIKTYFLTSGTFVVVAMGSLVLLQKGLGLEIVQTNHPPIVEICAIFCNNSFEIVRNISSLIIIGNTDAFSK